MLRLTPTLEIADDEIDLVAIRAQGAGGQNVNKVASAVQLRFDIRASSLPEALKARLLELRDRRLNDEGVLVIKAQRHRTQEQNRAEAIERLQEIVAAALIIRKPRRATRPTRSSKERRLAGKRQAARTKTLRRPVGTDD